MVLFRRPPKTTAGRVDKNLQRRLNKDLRGADWLVAAALEPGEKLVNFYKTPEHGANRGLYVFITDRRLLFAPMSGTGRVHGHAHADLRGLRVRDNEYRLAYEYARVTVHTLDFRIDGDALEAEAFLIQLREQWQRRTGRTWSAAGIQGSAACAPF
ncbi:MAG: hypothetical protein JWM76_4735 [Pseudonocardiales bacterium]|nr:hypothetical protein [Pseudonocardiales bacterium]